MYRWVEEGLARAVAAGYALPPLSQLVGSCLSTCPSTLPKPLYTAADTYMSVYLSHALRLVVGLLELEGDGGLALVLGQVREPRDALC